MRSTCAPDIPVRRPDGSRRTRSPAVLLAGCVANRMAQRQWRIDPTGLEPGAERNTVEMQLGRPVHEWDLRSGVHCASHEFVAGRLDNAGDAALMGAIDVATPGLFTGVDSLTQGSVSKHDLVVRRHVERVVVTYGSAGRALGLFDEYARLPPDGVSPPPRWTYP